MIKTPVSGASSWTTKIRLDLKAAIKTILRPENRWSLSASFSSCQKNSDENITETHYQSICHYTDKDNTICIDSLMPGFSWVLLTNLDE